MIRNNKTLWVFGDSNTAGHGCVMGFEYYEKYYKEGDKIWPNYLSEWLGVRLENKGRGGSSNDMILDSIIDSFDNIKGGDVVVIGKTYSHRFDIPHTDELYAVFWDKEDFIPNGMRSQFTQQEKEIILNFQYHFMLSPLFDRRWGKRYQWIKGVLEDRGCKCIVWDVVKDLELNEFQTIHIVTKGEMEDYHMSFKGHLDFSTHIWNKWFKEKTLI